jgi:YegS/Rv2252/BmrU family lipid kinase
MEPASPDARQRLFVILNPVAGTSNREEIQQLLNQHCQDLGWDLEIFETSGEENIAEVARQASQRGATLVAAAGGDGTVNAVVNGLVHSQTPLVVLPVGTGNGLARALNIPLGLQDACQLMVGNFHTRRIDAMQVGDLYFVLNVSAGVSARAMQETDSDQKRRIGMLAYAQTILKDLTAVQPRRFNLTLDGMFVQVNAIEVLVSNGRVSGEPPFLFGSAGELADGELDVNIVTASNPADYARLAWDLLVTSKERVSELHDLVIQDRLLLEVEGDPLPVQGDGEVIGETPVEVRLVPQALQVVVPEQPVNP